MSDVKPVAWIQTDALFKLNDNRIYSVMTELSCGDRAKAKVPVYSQETIDALQAEIESMRQKVGTGRAIIIDLLDQIESLQSYELTRDLEGYKAQAIWDSAIENAKRYAALAKEKQP